MAAYKKQTVHILNNSEVKEWIPDKNKRLRLQVKLKGDLRRLGLSKRATRKGLIQLGSKTYVVLKRLPLSHFRKLQSSHSSNQNSLFRKEKSENKHRNDAEGQGVENLRDIPQQFDTQVPSAAVATAPINALDANETCQSKTQVYNLFETELLDGTVQDFTSKLTRKDSHIDVTSTNYEDISTERSDINAAPGSFSSEDESLRKYTQNFVEGAGASVDQKYLSSRNHQESSDTAVPIRLKKHHSDSERSVAPTEDNDVFAREHNGKKKHKTEQQQKLSSVKAITDTLQKCSNKSRNNVLPKSNVSSLGDTIISESKKYLETDKLIDENEDAFTLKEHTQTHVDSALVEHIDKLLGQTSEKNNVNQIEINTESKSPQTDSPIEINSEAIIKRKLGSCSLDQTGSPIKIRKGNKVKMSSEDKIMTDNNIEKSDNEMLSDNESARTKQKIWKNITQHIRKRERYKLLKQKRERHQESWYTKVKSIRDKMHEYFRGPFDPDTSESDEEHEIVCNYLKRRLQSGDPLYDETTKEAKYIFKEDKKSHDISADNLQKGIESATSTKMKFDNLRNSVSIEKHVIYNATTDKETEDEVSVRKHCMPDNSQESIKNINFGNSDSTDSACTEKYSWHDVTDEETKDEASTCAHDTSPDNLQENVEKTIPVEVTFDNSCDSIVNTEKSVMYNAIDDEKVKNKTLICGTSVNSSQENINYAISAKVNSKNSCDSIANTEECYATSDIITDKKVEDRVSLCKYNALANNLQENVNSDVLARKQHVENFSSIVDTDNCSKSDGHAETSKNIIPSTIEMDLDQTMSIENIHLNDNLKKKVDNTSAKIDKKNILTSRQEDQEVCNAQNVDLAQCKSTQNCATSIWKLTIMSAHESTWREVDENDIRDTSQTVSNLLVTSNNNIVRDEKTVDQFSMILSTLKENSLKRKHDESLSVQTKNSSLSNLNCRDDNDSLQNSNSKDDSSDIEVEIKIASKLKSQMSRKYSLKAPWSAVNMCIKDLHKLQDNPNVLDELSKMNKTSERYKCKSTSKNIENNTLLDDNENVPVETEGCDITCDSSSTAKDNVNGSPQQRNLQDDLILDKNSNAMDHSQKGRDELSESVDPITTEDSSESNKLACDKSNLAEASTDDKRKTNEEQNSNNRTLEKVGSVAEHSREKENQGVSSIAQKKIQMATENSSENTAKAAYNGPNIEEPRTSANATHSIRVRSFEELSSRIIEKSTNLNVSVPSKSTRSEFCQLESFQSVSQLASPQSVPLQSTPLQSAPLQPTPLQSAPLQLTQPQLKHSQPIYQSVPSQLISQSTRPQLVALQSGSTQSVPVQLVPFQPIRPQLVPPQSGLSRSAPLQSAPQPTHPQLVSSQLTPQSVPIRPTFDTAVRHMHYSSRTNAPITPVTLSESNTAIINDSIKLRILTAVRNICADIEYCRSLRQYKQVKNVPPEWLQKMYVNIRQIIQCLTNLMQWLHMGNVQHVLNYVNQYNFLNHPITLAEINNYIILLQTYKFDITQEQNSAKSNVSLHSNIGQSVPNVSMPSVNAQPLSRGAPFQDAIMPNYGNFTQSSTIPRPVAIIPNVNQQQLFGNSVNSQQAPHFRQPMPNIRQQYNTSYASAAHPRMPNVNQQQFLKNASHPLQGQYVQLANVLNVGIQQVSVNTCNVSPSNTNLVSVNQGNTNVSPATNTRQSHATLRNTTNNITTATFTANAQQQKPMYFQKLQANSEITIRAVPTTVNKNISPGIHQNSMSGFSMANSNTQRPGDAMGNAERGSANQRQMSYNQQVSQSSTEKAQYTRYLNPNEIYPVVPQLMQCNVQKHSLQNTQPDQTVQQTLQQNLQESQHLIQPKDRSVCIIDLTTDNVSQNMAQNMSQNKPNKKAKFSELQNVQQKTSSTNPQQDVCRETLSVPPRDISHNISGTAPRTFTSQNANVSQNTVSEISSQKDDSVLLSLLNSTLYSFNPVILTDIQKILLRNQLRLYFSMNQQRYGLSERESKQLHHERSVLRCLYQNLRNYINNMIKQSQSTEKSSESVREDLQGNTSQNKSVLQENMIQQTSVGKLTKTQTSSKLTKTQNNEINSECNTNSPMVVERNLEAPNKEVFFTSELITVSESSVTRTKEPLTKDTGLQEQSNDTLKKKFQKSLLLDILLKKRPNNTKVLSPRHSRTLEENSIIDVPAKNSVTEVQDNVRIIESLKASSPIHSKTAEENLITEVSAKNSETEGQDNARIIESLKVSSPVYSRISEENLTTEVPVKNSEIEAQDIANIIESLKALSSRHSRTLEENLIIDVPAKNSVTEVHDNARIIESLKAPSPIHSKTSEENLITEVSAKNSERIAQDNAMIIECLKALSPIHSRTLEEKSITEVPANNSETEIKYNTSVIKFLKASSRYSRPSEENSITEVPANNSETEAQDNEKIIEPLKALSPKHSRTLEENSITNVSAKNSETEVKDNTSVIKFLKASSSGYSRTSEENLITEVSAKNSEIEAQENSKIIESLKALSPRHSKTQEENLIIDVPAKNSETEVQDNTSVIKFLKASSPGYSRESEENSITEVPAKNSEIEAQENSKIIESLKALSPRHSKTQEENLIIDVPDKNSETEVQDNTSVIKLLKASSPGYSRESEENSITEVLAKNSKVEVQDNAKIIESLKVLSLRLSRTLEENSIIDLPAKNSETEDNASINSIVTLKASLPGHSRTLEENLITMVSGKNSETEAQDNARIIESLKALSPGHSRTSEENSITEVLAKNSETEDDAKINEPLKTVSSYNKKFLELCSITQNLLNLLQNALTEKTEVPDQTEIAKTDANEKSNNVETENINENSNLALNNIEENDAILQSPYNTEDQSKEVYYTCNEIPSKTLQDIMRDDINENNEILNSAEVQSDPLHTSLDSVPVSPNNVRSMSPIKECESTKTLQVYSAHEKHAETVLDIQQEDFMYEQSNDSIGETYSGASETSGKLYIDESVEESQKEDQCDEVSSSDEDKLTISQDSAFDATGCDSTEVMPLSRVEDMEIIDVSQDFVTETQNIETLNEESLEVKKILLGEISEFEDEWDIKESIQPIDIKTKLEDAKKEDSKKLLLEEIKFEETSLKFEVWEDAWSMEESAMRRNYQNLSGDIEEKKLEIDTHSSIKAINEPLRYVPEQEYYENSPTSSCNYIQKNPTDVNVEEVLVNNDILNADVECISVGSDDSKVVDMPNILNIRSISPSLFDKIENVNTYLQGELELLNEKNEKSVDINDNLGISDDVDERPCLRCKRKSTVYCQACLEAHYCSKRCSSLHWNAEHYKQCKGHDSIICLDV